jgi:hypothetical protein
MDNVIGAADDFYRLRVARIDDTEAVDFDWRDDILWREPPVKRPEEREVWRIEAVRIDDDVALPIADYESAEEAHVALEGLEEELCELTKSQFEARYLEG